MKTLGIYIWYFFAESEIFPKILIAVSLVIFGMFLEIAVIAIGTWAGVFFGLWLWCKVAGMN